MYLFMVYDRSLHERKSKAIVKCAIQTSTRLEGPYRRWSSSCNDDDGDPFAVGLPVRRWFQTFSWTQSGVQSTGKKKGKSGLCTKNCWWEHMGFAVTAGARNLLLMSGGNARYREPRERELIL